MLMICITDMSYIYIYTYISYVGREQHSQDRRDDRVRRGHALLHVALAQPGRQAYTIVYDILYYPIL